jgi:hypothetical protein
LNGIFGNPVPKRLIRISRREEYHMNPNKGKMRCEDAMQVSLAQDLPKEVHSRCVKILTQETNLAFSTANYSELHFI